MPKRKVNNRELLAECNVLVRWKKSEHWEPGRWTDDKFYTPNGRPTIDPLEFRPMSTDEIVAYYDREGIEFDGSDPLSSRAAFMAYADARVLKLAKAVSRGAVCSQDEAKLLAVYILKEAG